MSDTINPVGLITLSGADFIQPPPGSTPVSDVTYGPSPSLDVMFADANLSLTASEVAAIDAAGNLSMETTATANGPGAIIATVSGDPTNGFTLHVQTFSVPSS